MIFILIEKVKIEKIKGAEEKCFFNLWNGKHREIKENHKWNY